MNGEDNLSGYFLHKTALLLRFLKRRRMKKVTIKEIKKSNGCDCWGRPEYDNYYVVEDKNGEVIYTSESDPTNLINYLCNQ